MNIKSMTKNVLKVMEHGYKQQAYIFIQNERLFRNKII
jgi:hypothetical protein